MSLGGRGFKKNFVLEDKKLQYEKTYGKNDKMFLECINEEADVKEFLKDKRLESI